MWFSKTSQEGAKTQRKPFTFYRTFFKNIMKLPTKKKKLKLFTRSGNHAPVEKAPPPITQKPSAKAAFRAVRPVLITAHKRDGKFATAHKSLTAP